MEMRSYSEIYLNEAKQHLGAATDYLVNVCGIAADRVGYIYASSPMVARFSRGDPGVLAGMSGIELGQRLCLEDMPADIIRIPFFEGEQDQFCCDPFGGKGLDHLVDEIDKPGRYMLGKVWSEDRTEGLLVQVVRFYACEQVDERHAEAEDVGDWKGVANRLFRGHIAGGSSNG